MICKYLVCFFITALPASEHDELLSLLEKIGGVVSKMPPENIIMITQAGSYIYNLSMPSSDVDYIVVYKEPTEVLVIIYCRVPPL